MMAAGLEDKYFKGLVITETVKRAVVSELTPMPSPKELNNRQIFCKLSL